MSEKQYILISNQSSGSYNEEKINIFIKELNKNNIKVQYIKLKKRQSIGSIIKCFKKNQKYLIIFACGDGTINSAINEINLRKDKENFYITVLPLGTTNVLAKELNIFSIKDAVKSILNNKIKKIHLGCIQEDSNELKQKYFLLMASTGLDALAINNLEENLKNKIGKFAYIFSFFQVFLKNYNENVQAIINNKKYSGKIIGILNQKYYGGNHKISDKNIENNIFEVLIIKKFNIFSLVRYYFFKKSKNITSIWTDKIQLSSQNKNFIEIDGDIFCNLPATITNSNHYINSLTL